MLAKQCNEVLFWVDCLVSGQIWRLFLTVKKMGNLPNLYTASMKQYSLHYKATSIVTVVTIAWGHRSGFDCWAVNSWRTLRRIYASVKMLQPFTAR